LEPTQFIRLVSAFATALGGLFLAFALVRGRLGAMRRRALRIEPPRALTDPEREYLQRWQWRTLSWFVVTMAVLGAYALSFAAAPWLPSSGYVVGSILVIALGAAGLVVHFAARCPVCGWRIGYRSTLWLPVACEACGALFRPESIWAAAQATGAGPVRVVSNKRILGVPLFAVAYGREPAGGQRRGVAKGLVAVGNVALGIVAVGDVAVGVVPVGAVAVGVLPVGGLSLGVFAVGGLAFGLAALGGVAVGGVAIGGLALGFRALGGVTFTPSALLGITRL
jgi:hypothetical protein